MKMKLKINASNKSNSSSTFKNKERYVYDNLMSDPFFFIIFLSNFFLNIFMGFFHFFFTTERNINNNKYLVIGKK